MIDTGKKGLIGATQDTGPASAPILTRQTSDGGIGQSRARAAKALGSIGVALGNMGDKGIAIANDLERTKNARISAEARLEWESELSAFNRDILTNPDPETWSADFDERFGEMKARSFGGAYMPRRLREGLEQQWDVFHTRAKNKMLEGAATLMVDQARAAGGQMLDMAIEAGDTAAYKGHLDEMREEGLMSKPQYDIALKKGLDQIRERQIAILRDDDPFALKEAMARGEFPGMSRFERMQHDKLTERAIAYERREIGADLADRIYAGEITDAKQIGKLGSRLRERTRGMLRDILGREMDGVRRMPEVQQQIAGEARLLIADYKPDADGYDEGYVEIAGTIGQLEDGPVKREFQRILNGIRSDEFGQVDNIRDSAFKKLDEAAKTGVYGVVDDIRENELTLEDALNGSNFLETRSMMEAVGLSEVEAIRVSKGETLQERVELFRDTYPNRTGTTSVKDFALAEQILKSENLASVVGTHEDPQSRIKAEQQTKERDMRLGRATAELSDWFQSHPKATPDEVEAKIHELGVQARAEGLKASVVSPRVKPPATVRLPFRPEFSTSQGRAERARSGGATVLMDSNMAKGVPVISPRIVLPDDATPLQRKMARAYVDRVAELQRERFGRNLRPQVLTRSDNKRGRSNAIHTEGFAITDPLMVPFLLTRPGRAAYQEIVSETLGQIPGVEFTLPHSATDPGATVGDLSEVSLARWLQGSD